MHDGTDLGDGPCGQETLRTSGRHRHGQLHPPDRLQHNEQEIGRGGGRVCLRRQSRKRRLHDNPERRHTVGQDPDPHRREVQEKGGGAGHRHERAFGRDRGEFHRGDRSRSRAQGQSAQRLNGSHPGPGRPYADAGEKSQESPRSRSQAPAGHSKRRGPFQVSADGQKARGQSERGGRLRPASLGQIQTPGDIQVRRLRSFHRHARDRIVCGDVGSRQGKVGQLYRSGCGTAHKEKNRRSRGQRRRTGGDLCQ